MEQENHGTSSGRVLLERVLAHRSKFLQFLTSRVEDRGTAEDILQTAYVKEMERGSKFGTKRAPWRGSTES